MRPRATAPGRPWQATSGQILRQGTARKSTASDSLESRPRCHGQPTAALNRLNCCEKQSHSDVGDPEFIGRRRREPSAHEVGRGRRLGRGAAHAALAASRDALDLELAHEAGDALARDAQAVHRPQLGVDARRPVDAVRGGVDLMDALPEPGVFS